MASERLSFSCLRNVTQTLMDTLKNQGNRYCYGFTSDCLFLCGTCGAFTCYRDDWKEDTQVDIKQGTHSMYSLNTWELEKISHLIVTLDCQLNCLNMLTVFRKFFVHVCMYQVLK